MSPNVWGLPLSTFTQIHVLISLIGIVAGFVALFGLLRGRLYRTWTAIFLATTVLTSVTGFGFPIRKIGPPHIVGGLSLIALVIAIAALYLFALRGGWRRTYVITAVISLYFNVFVLVAQAFDKVASLKALAPTQSEPPFAVAQGVVLVLFVALGWMASTRFTNAQVAPIQASPVT